MRAVRALGGLVRAARACASSPGGERLRFAEAWARLLWHDLAFRWRRSGRGLGRSRAAVRPAFLPAADAGRLVAIFERAAHNHLGRVACLPRSLALLAFLGRHGIHAKLRLGVRRGEAGIEGHAWLEHEGEPVSCGREAVAGFAPLQFTRSEDGA